MIISESTISPQLNFKPFRHRLALLILVSMFVHVLILSQTNWDYLLHTDQAFNSDKLEVTFIERKPVIEQHEVIPTIKPEKINATKPPEIQKQTPSGKAIKENASTPSPTKQAITEPPISEPAQGTEKSHNAARMILQSIDFARKHTLENAKWQERKQFAIQPVNPQLVAAPESSEQAFVEYRDLNGNTIIGKKSLLGMDVCLEAREADPNQAFDQSLVYLNPC